MPLPPCRDIHGISIINNVLKYISDLGRMAFTSTLINASNACSNSSVILALTPLTIIHDLRLGLRLKCVCVSPFLWVKFVDYKHLLTLFTNVLRYAYYLLFVTVPQSYSLGSLDGIEFILNVQLSSSVNSHLKNVFCKCHLKSPCNITALIIETILKQLYQEPL